MYIKNEYGGHPNMKKDEKKEAELLETEVVVWGKEDAKEVYDVGCYGKIKDEKLILSFCEALHLMERKKLRESYSNVMMLDH